jgi:hypothetical protein
MQMAATPALLHTKHLFLAHCMAKMHRKIATWSRGNQQGC